MEKLEQSQRLAAEERRRRAEEKKRQSTEAVAQPLHTAEEITPAFVPESSDTPARKQLPS
jgi:hypothetical protein